VCAHNFWTRITRISTTLSSVAIAHVLLRDHSSHSLMRTYATTHRHHRYHNHPHTDHRHGTCLDDTATDDCRPSGGVDWDASTRTVDEKAPLDLDPNQMHPDHREFRGFQRCVTKLPSQLVSPSQLASRLPRVFVEMGPCICVLIYMYAASRSPQRVLHVDIPLHVSIAVCHVAAWCISVVGVLTQQRPTIALRSMDRDADWKSSMQSLEERPPQATSSSGSNPSNHEFRGLLRCVNGPSRVHTARVFCR
jgi:hypothetical protein